MYRSTILLILFCLTAALCIQELFAQPAEGERDRRGGRRNNPQAAAPENANAGGGSQNENTESQEDNGDDSQEAPPAFTPPNPPLNSLASRLIHPDIANRLGLTDAQRAEATRIINAQVLEISNLPKTPAPEQFEEVKKQYEEAYKRNEEKLAGVLTATQRAVLEQGLDGKKLRIVAKSLPWKDALQIVADQGGFQLVMDSPPPGTLNYTDPQERSIIEVLDFINGILITSGYTVTRKDQMLLVLDLRKPIPNWSFPSVKSEELPGRGSSEFVSVIFNLERRNRENVKQGLKPLENPYTRVFDMPGNNLMVIDRVEVLNAVQKIINSVENPPVPQKKPEEKPKPQPQPIWKTYTIEKNQPEKIETIFKEYVPNAKITRLENSRQMHIFIQPGEHEKLEAILKMLEEDTGAEQSGQAVLKSYPIAQYLDPSLNPVAQDWRMNRMFGRRNQMNNPYLNQQLALNPNRTMQIQNFGTQIIASLKKAFPLAIISDSPVAESVVVLTQSQAEQDKIGEFFESLHPAKEEQPVMKLYRFTEKGKKLNESHQEHLQALVPTAMLTLDEERGQILVVATAEEQQTMSKAITELETEMLPADDKILQAYRLSTTSFQSFLMMVRQLAQQDRLEGYFQLQDIQRRQVLIWATAKQHELLDKVYQEVTGQSQLTGDAASGSRTLDAVIPFSPKNISLETLTDVVEDVYPTVKITTDEDRGQLIIRIPPEQKETLLALLKELDAADPEEEKRFFKPYPFESGFYSLGGGFSRNAPLRIIDDLEKLAPNARITFDDISQQLVVWGTEEEQTIIETAIKHLIGDKETKVLRIQLRRMTFGSLAPTLRRMFPTVMITPDSSTSGALLVEGHPKLLPKVKDLIEMLDPEETSEFDPIVKFYPLKSEPNRMMINALERLTNDAEIVADDEPRQIMVIAKPAEHKIIEKNLAAIDSTFAEPEMKLQRFYMNRAPYWSVMSTIERMYRDKTLVSYDYAGKGIMVEADAETMAKVVELVALLDPVEPSENDPHVKFYALETEPTDMLVRALDQIAPAARIIPDRLNKQLMVIARPAEHKDIEANTKIIMSTFTPPEEPILCIYPATNEERDRLTAFMDTAEDDLRGAVIVPESIPTRGQNRQRVGTTETPANRISIWARPTEHKLIAAVLKQIQESRTDVPDRKIKSFPMSVGDLEIAENILRVSHPDAMLFPDETANRLLVWATESELAKVTETLRVQGSIDDRQMLSYPIAGVRPANAVKVIQDVFQGLKITEEPQSRKILVWASPEEHVKIAEIVEQINKEAAPDSELAEKFVAYSAANLDATMIQQLFRTLIPDADVHASPDQDKIVVRAIARDHKRIEELFTQLREKDETLRLQLMVYPFGNIDPIMVEAMLRNQLPDARSMSPDTLVWRLGSTYMYERYYGRMMGINVTQSKNSGYYNVDPQTHAVHVFATGEQHQEIDTALKQLIAAGDQEGIKLVIKRYALDEIEDFYDVQDLIQKVVPSAMIQPLYTRTVNSNTGRITWNPPREFLAYTNEGEHERLETLVTELNDKSGMSRKEILSLTLPEKSPYGREKIIETIQSIFPDITPMTGGAPNQILLWAPKHRLEQIQKIVTDVCQPLPEGERAIPKAYPLQYISVEEATAWLSALYPNVSFDPAQLAAAVQAARGSDRNTREMQGQNRRYQRPDNAKFVVVVATPLEHAEIGQAILELDKDLPDSYKMVPRMYSFDDFSRQTFYPLYGSLNRAFPNTVVTPSSEQMSMMVVATEDDHKKIADFIAAYREDNERKQPSLAIYTLKRQNFWQMYSLVRQIAPDAAIFGGSRPDQIAVWGTPKERADIEAVLAKMETAADAETSQSIMVYKTGAGKAVLTRQLLAGQFPGTLVFEINQNEILAWASAADHEAMSKMLGTVAEAFPEPVMKPYFFKHVPLAEGATVLRQAFVGQATMTVRPTTDDLLVFAAPEVHEKIAASIAEFDIPRPADADTMPETYDLSDLPPAAFAQAVGQIRAVTQYRVQITQGVVPGQLVVMGKKADQDKVRTMIEQMLAQRPEVTAETRTYTVRRSNARTVAEPLIRQVAPNAVPYPGTTANQIVVWAKESDHVKIAEAIEKLNGSDPDMSLRIYRTGMQKAQTTYTILTQQFPGLLAYPTSTSELVAWATSEEHKLIADMLQTVAEALPDPVMKPYFFKHVPLNEGWTVLYQTFSGLATFTYRPSTGDLLAYAPPNIHEKIAASIEAFDHPRPAETEEQTAAHDLSRLPLAAFNQTATQIAAAFVNRVRVLPSVLPGQLLVWGKQADLEKVQTMVDQIMSERPETTATLQPYMIRRGTIPAVVAMIQSILPHIQPPQQGTNPKQILVWANESDQAKVKDIVDTLNESEPDMTLVAYSLKNVNSYSATSVLNTMTLREGLDIRTFYDVYSRQMLILAKSEDHKIVADVFDKFRTEERNVESFTMEYADPVAAQTAIDVLFYDEPTATKPWSQVEPNTNMLFVEGTKEQLTKVRALLRKMGEIVPEPQGGEVEPQTQTAPMGSSNVRVLHLRGGSANVLRELENLWKQTQPNQLRIINDKKEENETPLYSVEDEIVREPDSNNVTEPSAEEGNNNVPSPQGGRGQENPPSKWRGDLKAFSRFTFWLMKTIR